jgi:HPt (histidine-containing phosphotransfer) domain-containing protein
MTTSLPIALDMLLEQCCGSGEFAASLLSDFGKDLLARCAGIIRHLDASDAPAVTATAHCLKGSAGMLGAAGLSEIAARIEAAGRSGDLADSAPLAAQLRDEAQRCLQFLPAMQAELAASVEIGAGAIDACN